jgi:D-lactate dehydrogenase
MPVVRVLVYFSNMKLAFYSTQSYDKEYFTRLNPGHDINFLETTLREKTVKLITEETGVCAFVNDDLSAPVIYALADKGIKLIAMRCAGYNNVDLSAANQAGIAVVRVPAYSPYAVAEHAVAMIMTLNRKTHKAYNRVREGNFSLDRLTGFDLHGKTVGVVGMGKIGRVFSQIMSGFGCKVLVHDLYPDPSWEQKGWQITELEELFRLSDIISLHCPLTENTRHLINQKTIHLMKRGVMIINTGRGALIDTGAVIHSLKTGRIGYLGIDVYEQEENLFFRDLSENVIQDDQILRLMSFPNVLITAHQAFFTDEALSEISRVTFDNIESFEKGTELKNLVSLPG